MATDPIGAAEPLVYYAGQPEKPHKFSRRTRLGILIGLIVVLWLVAATLIKGALS